MAAGLQIYEQLRPFGLLPCSSQSFNFAVGTPSPFMVALGNNASIFDDHGSDHGVGRGSAGGFPSKLQSPTHPLFLMFLFQNIAVVEGKPAFRLGITA
jgi:hypothetical protein